MKDKKTAENDGNVKTKQYLAIALVVIGLIVIGRNLLLTIELFVYGGSESAFAELIGVHLWTVVSAFAIYKLYPTALNKQ